MDQYPLLSPALSLPGGAPRGSRQTTVSPGAPAVVGPLRGKFISSISPLLACQAQARPPPVCHWALLTQMSTVKGALRLPPGRPAGLAQGLCRNAPTGPLQEPRLPHLRNCQNLTGYFTRELAMEAAADTDKAWQILDCLPDDKAQLSETCRLHSICSACFLLSSQVTGQW